MKASEQVSVLYSSAVPHLELMSPPLHDTFVAEDLLLSLHHGSRDFLWGALARAAMLGKTHSQGKRGGRDWFSQQELRNVG